MQQGEFVNKVFKIILDLPVLVHR